MDLQTSLQHRRQGKMREREREKERKRSVLDGNKIHGMIPKLKIEM